MKNRKFDWLSEVFQLQLSHQESRTEIARLEDELDAALNHLHQVLDHYENGTCEPAALLRSFAKTLAIAQESTAIYERQLQQVESFLQRIPFDLSDQRLISLGGSGVYDSRKQFDA